MLKVAILRVLVAAVILSFWCSSGSASIVMRVDTTNDSFYFEGTDSGTPYFYNESGFTSYDLQFYIELPSEPSASEGIYGSPQQLFISEADSGKMNMIKGTTNYVFIDLSSDTNFSTLTGGGPSVTASYAGLSATNQAIFESLIGQSMSLTFGTGFSPIAIVAVPEASTLALLSGVAVLGFCLFRRR